MSVQYTNRVGKTYSLYEGKTKTGKPRYFFSSRQDGKGEVVEHIPEGFEIYEHPKNAQVFLRKKRPKLITDIEKHLVEKHVKQLTRSKRYRVDCKDKCIIIYESDVNIGELKDILSDFVKYRPPRPGMDADETLNTLVNIADQNYSAVLRFRLIDKERRTFVAERFCFRSSIDDWIFLGSPGDLKKIAASYVSLLGTDNFFNFPF